MYRKSTDLEALALQIEQAQQAAEQHRVEYQTTVRHLMNYREQELRRLDGEIAERREQAERRLADDERRTAELIHLRRGDSFPSLGTSGLGDCQQVYHINPRGYGEHATIVGSIN